MGYETTYSGRIKIGKNIIKKLKEEYGEDGVEEYFEIWGIELEDDSVDICGYGKMYDNELENLCLFLAKLDNGAIGDIECNGEDSDDFWLISVELGEVYIKRGKIVYDEGGDNYNNTNINKDVYKITKDKRLLKEMILDGLKDE